jgi:hypothetical protein
MASFNTLYEVSQMLSMVLADKTDVLQANILILPPPASVPSTEQIYISLLWVNESAHHKNDIYERQPDGTQVPPPITMSTYYLISSSGTSNNANAIRQHQILGEILRVFHTYPRLELPLKLTGNLNGQVTPGKGAIAINQVPQSEEMMEKLFSLLQIPHRPFVLYEVVQAQLASYAPVLAPAMVVVPGGPNIVGPTTQQPVITSVLPRTSQPGLRIRVDGTFPNSPTAVYVGAGTSPGSKLLIPTANITILNPGQTFTAVLPTTLGTGVMDVTFQVTSKGTPPTTQSCAPFSLKIVDNTNPGIDAPNTLTQSRTQALNITGNNLLNVASVVAWPDGGLRSPSDFKTLAVSPGINANKVTVPAANMTAANLRLQPYRFAVKTPTGAFTPYILLNIVP